MSPRLALLISFCFACHAFVVPSRRSDSIRLEAHRASSRRVFLDTIFIGSFVAASPAAFAEDTDPFDAVRRELQSAEGGIAYMQRCIDQADFTGLMEFTKTYDQVLRKGAIGKAKKTLESKDAATLISNAVTFDLIGINRSSRPGKENAEDAAKYLQELREDVQRFLDLEEK